MCPPNAAASLSCPSSSRRGVLKFGLGAAAAALAMPLSQAHAASVRRTSFSNVADLTHRLGPQFPLFPGAPAFTITPIVSHDANGYYGSVLNYWEHSGTHMDAPIHFAKDGLFVDQLEVQNLVVPAVVIDVTASVQREPAYEVTPDDIRAWERRYGRLPDNAAVLMASGWGRGPARPRRSATPTAAA